MIYYRERTQSKKNGGGKVPRPSREETGTQASRSPSHCSGTGYSDCLQQQVVAARVWRSGVFLEAGRVGTLHTVCTHTLDTPGRCVQVSVNAVWKTAWFVQTVQMSQALSPECPGASQGQPRRRLKGGSWGPATLISCAPLMRRWGLSACPMELGGLRLGQRNVAKVALWGV